MSVTIWKKGTITAKEFVLLREPAAHVGNFGKNSVGIFGDNCGIEWVGPMLHSEFEPSEEEAWNAAARNLSLGWINDLPPKARKYIHDLETRCDPQGIIQNNAILQETVEAMLKLLRSENNGFLSVKEARKDV